MIKRDEIIFQYFSEVLSQDPQVLVDFLKDTKANQKAAIIAWLDDKIATQTQAVLDADTHKQNMIDQANAAKTDYQDLKDNI